ncbi:hypothetical protein Tco_0149062 [Tanacetum coccineum]
MKKDNISIEEMRREQLMVDDEIKDISNYLSYKRFRGEKIDYSIQTQEYLKKFSSTITPVLPIEEPDNSLSLGDEHLDTIPSVENLVPIPSEFEGISDDTCDVSVGEDPSTFDALSDHSEILSDSNDDGTSSDDNDFEDIEYVSLEEVNDETEFDLEDILQIQDVILREKLLNVHRLVTNIESLKNNPTPYYVLESPSSFSIPVVDSDSFFEESDTSLSHLDNSLPRISELLADPYGRVEKWLVVISDNSNGSLLELPEFKSFHFDPSFPRLPPEPPDVEISLLTETDAPVINNFDELNEDVCFYPEGGEINVSQNAKNDDSFALVIQTFLPFLTYPVDSPLLLSTGSEDTIFDPGIST